MSEEDWQDPCRRGEAALETGDIEAAGAHLAEAAAAAGRAEIGPPVKLRLLEADILCRLGDAEGAERMLVAAAAAFPANPWPSLRLAGLKRQQGEIGVARQHLDEARSRDPLGDLSALHALDADLCLDAGDPGAAVAALRALERVDPAHPGLEGAFGRLLQSLEAAPPERAVAVLESLQETGRTAGEQVGQEAGHALALPLARAYARAGRQADLEAQLTRMLAEDASDPELLRLIFTTPAADAPVAVQLAAAQAVAARVDAALGRELRLPVLIRAGRAEEALETIRAAGPRRDRPGEARALAMALFAQGRYATGLRYLRACLQRWPEAPGLIALAFHWQMQTGLTDAARDLVTRAGRALPERQKATFRFLLAAHAGDVWSTLGWYGALVRAGGPSAAQREMMARVIQAFAPLEELAAIHDDIGQPAAVSDRPLHRSGRAGLVALELELERRGKAPAAPEPNPFDWVRSRPGSTVAAIRLLGHWTGSVPPAGRAGDNAIPRRIFQYWHAAEPPAAVTERVAGWAAAERHEHRLLSRPAARDFLRGSFGPQWLRAFDMARQPAEEAGLLRLCLLVHHGGIWADAGDRLHGDLGGLLAARGGLVAGIEPVGGALADNLLAAPPRHPALILAAKMARQALLQRSADIVWAKTGGGLLTRAVAQYIARRPEPETRRTLALLPAAEVRRVVVADTLPGPVGPDHATDPPPLWRALIEALGGRDAASG